MTSTDELRAQLAALQAEHDAIFAELLPTAKPGIDGRVRWSDEVIAIWLGCDLDTVRSWIVKHLHDFAVDDDCRAALLTVPQIVALTAAADFKTPRIREADFLAAQIALTSSRLAELGG